MMTLRKLNKKQSKIFKKHCLWTQEQRFCEFLSMNPNLYNGVDLNNYEIDYINNHFWDYWIEPQTFEFEFIQSLRESVPRYKNLKLIELQEDLLSLISEKTVRHKVIETIGNMNREQTSIRNTESNSTTNNKNASRELPMKSTGANFDNTINWASGASDISENKNIASATISNDDVNHLVDSMKNNGDETETLDRRIEAPVDIINRIYNYLLKPKSLEYLTSALAKSFILIY